MKLLFILILFLNLLNAHSSEALIKKGELISNRVCDKKAFPSPSLELKAIEKELQEKNICGNLNSFNLKAVALYIKNQNPTDNKSIDVPKDAKCPVCGMFVSKYPKWVAVIDIDSKRHYFDGVKDMMKYYLFDGDFKYNRANISKILVTNYYTLKAIDAKKAFYVYDSKVLGPMGRELITFSTKKEADNFIKDHGGELMKFSDITPQKVMALDGIEMK